MRLGSASAWPPGDPAWPLVWSHVCVTRATRCYVVDALLAPHRNHVRRRGAPGDYRASTTASASQSGQQMVSVERPSSDRRPSAPPSPHSPARSSHPSASSGPLNRRLAPVTNQLVDRRRASPSRQVPTTPHLSSPSGGCRPAGPTIDIVTAIRGCWRVAAGEEPVTSPSMAYSLRAEQQGRGNETATNLPRDHARARRRRLARAGRTRAGDSVAPRMG